VADAIASGNEMVTNAPRLSTAIGIVRRAESRKADAEILAIGAAPATTVDTPRAGPIINADFNQWARTYEGPKFNFVHCDFPYGINADKFNQGAASLHGGYADTENTYWQLCTSLITNLDRLCAPSSHFMFWFSMHFYQETLDFFHKNSDIRFDKFPLIWTKSDNIGICQTRNGGQGGFMKPVYSVQEEIAKSFDQLQMQTSALQSVMSICQLSLSQCSENSSRCLSTTLQYFLIQRAALDRLYAQQLAWEQARLSVWKQIENLLNEPIPPGPKPK
jgi:hypothetical protein